MAGLVDYNSSDEEVEEPAEERSLAEHETDTVATTDAGTNGGHSTSTGDGAATNRASAQQTTPAAAERAVPQATDAPPQGPSAGPASGPPDVDTTSEDSEPASAQQIMHSMTLPPIPNTVIPPSPPGSPPPSASAKVSRFLKLKEQGVHFNAKLASSSQLRNPSLLQNLMNFAGINEGDGAGQYDTTLPEQLKPVPSDGLPKWAYVEELNKSQQEMQQKRVRERKEAGKVDFVPSKGSASSGSATSTPGSVNGVKGVVGNTHRKSRFEDDRRRGEPSRDPKRRKG